MMPIVETLNSDLDNIQVANSIICDIDNIDKHLINSNRLSLFGERRGSGPGSAPRTPRRASPRSRRSPAPSGASSASDEIYSDTDSLASVEMLTDDQIASLMLDAQLEAVCEKLAGVARAPRSPHSPESRL
ncbi:unnamed protein product [Colias eurytheme]|nr:unnamed protein product [Colias eurytheme]